MYAFAAGHPPPSSLPGTLMYPARATQGEATITIVGTFIEMVHLPLQLMYPNLELGIVQSSSSGFY